MGNELRIYRKAKAARRSRKRINYLTSCTLTRDDILDLLDNIGFVFHCDTLEIVTPLPVMDKESAVEMLRKEFQVSKGKMEQAVRMGVCNWNPEWNRIKISPIYLEMDRCTFSALEELVDTIAEIVITEDHFYMIHRFDWCGDLDGRGLYDPLFKIHHAILTTFRYENTNVKNSNVDLDDEFMRKAMNVEFKKKSNNYDFAIYDKEYVSEREGTSVRVELRTWSAKMFTWKEIRTVFLENWIDMLKAIPDAYDDVSLATNDRLLDEYKANIQRQPAWRSSWCNFVRDRLVDWSIWSPKQMTDLLTRLVKAGVLQIKSIKSSIDKFYRANPTFEKYKRTDIKRYLDKIIDGLQVYFEEPSQKIGIEDLEEQKKHTCRYAFLEQKFGPEKCSEASTEADLDGSEEEVSGEVKCILSAPRAADEQSSDDPSSNSEEPHITNKDSQQAYSHDPSEIVPDADRSDQHSPVVPFEYDEYMSGYDPYAVDEESDPEDALDDIQMEENLIGLDDLLEDYFGTEEEPFDPYVDIMEDMSISDLILLLDIEESPYKTDQIKHLLAYYIRFKDMVMSR